MNAYADLPYHSNNDSMFEAIDTMRQPADARSIIEKVAMGYVHAGHNYTYYEYKVDDVVVAIRDSNHPLTPQLICLISSLEDHEYCTAHEKDAVATTTDTRLLANIKHEYTRSIFCKYLCRLARDRDRFVPLLGAFTLSELMYGKDGTTILAKLGRLATMKFPEN